MTELIIIKTKHGQAVKKVLEEKHISYEIYQAPSKNFDLSNQWENQVLSDWTKLSDEQLIKEWDSLND